MTDETALIGAAPPRATAAPTAKAASEGRGYRAWLLFVLFLVCLLNYADRTVVASIAGSLRAELHLNDLQLGLLQGMSFALLYCLLGIPFARLSERHSRVKILAGATAVWSLMTMVCGAVNSFPNLLLARLGVGVGEAGFMGPAASLIGDHFPRSRRTMANSFMMMGVPFGALIGASSGGLIAQTLGWRWAFVIMGAPGLLVALLVLTLRDPERGAMDQEQDAETPSLRAVAANLFRSKTFLHVTAGGTLAGFGMQGLGAFLPLYYARVHGMAPAAAGLSTGVIAFLNVSGGLAFSGWLASWGARRDMRWLAWIPAVGSVASTGFYIAAFNATALVPSLALLAVAGIVLMSYFSPGLAMVQNLAGARSRASSIAIYSLIVNLVGLGVGPVLIGYASDRFAQAAYGGPLPESCKALAADLACRTALGTGLRHALMLMTCLFVWAGVHYYLAGRSQPKGAA